jgi:putative AlgH/UPF0301 family transcriptional regulator
MITTTDRFIGNLLASSPAIFHDDEPQQVILIISHTSQLAIGVQINQDIMGQTLQQVSRKIGIAIDGNDPIWYGGNLGKDKIHVIHSTDWMGASSVKIAPGLAVTNDISILAALSQSDGPSEFRACAGFCSWSNDELMHSLGVESATVERHQTMWEMVPATSELTMCNQGGDFQWLRTLEASAAYQSTQWF